jgi:hypothetical protein
MNRIHQNLINEIHDLTTKHTQQQPSEVATKQDKLKSLNKNLLNEINKFPL